MSPTVEVQITVVDDQLFQFYLRVCFHSLDCIRHMNSILTMSIVILFGLLLILWLLYGVFTGLDSNPTRRVYVDRILLFILLVILGWKALGPLLHV